MPDALQILLPFSAAILAAAARILARARGPRRGSYLQWACQHFVIPDGPEAGRKFDPQTQPWMALALRELDRQRWAYFFWTAGTQCGKTLLGVILLLCWLFHWKSKVVLGIPDLNLAADKWREHIEPALDAGGFSKHLPTGGPGSRGGEIRNAIRFKGAGTLKLMSGGKRDAGRSSYTAQCVFVTEADKVDEISAGSVETGKLNQLWRRADAYNERGAMRCAESTLTIRQGRMFREISAGTNTRIWCPCPHCGAYVCPKRAHLVGWQTAPDVLAAQALAHFYCPACGEKLNEAERRWMNRHGVLVHKGQQVKGRSPAEWSISTPDPEGFRPGDLLPGYELEGPLPRTNRFGLTVNAFNNLFISAGHCGEREWSAKFDPDAGEDHERDLCQNLWSEPYDAPGIATNELDAREVSRRTSQPARGMVPADAVHVTAALDLGKYLCHWVVLAFRPDGSPHVADYGTLEVNQQIGLEQALLVVCRQFRDLCLTGWARAAVDQTAKPEARVRPECVLVDSGWMSDVVYTFTRESVGGPLRIHPSKGFGLSQNGHLFTARKPGKEVPVVGLGYQLVLQGAERLYLYELDADEWKTRVTERFRTPAGNPGAGTLFEAPASEHAQFARHLTAEVSQQQYDVKRNREVTVWRNKAKRPNHWFDACAQAAAAGHLVGVRLLEEAAPPARKQRTARGGMRVRFR